MGDLEELETLIRRVEKEAAALEEYGYRFPAMYAALLYLLKKQMPC